MLASHTKRSHARREEMTVDDARSAVELIADDLASYPDDSLLRTFMDAFGEFMDSPARVGFTLCNSLTCRNAVS